MTPTDEIIYRAYRPGDERLIIELYNQEFSTPMTPESWRWEYLGNPAGRLDIVVAWVGDTLVGHCAAVPLLFRQNDRDIKATRMQNVLVHPEFQRRGIFFQTMHHLDEHLAQHSVDFVIGFPGDVRHSFAGLLKGGYDHLFDLFPFTQRIDGLPGDDDGSLRASVEEQPRFEPGDVDCVDAHIGSYRLFNSRRLDYLNWRFGVGGPKHYALARVFRDDRQIGWALGKPYAAGGSIDVVELFVPPQERVIAAVLGALAGHYRSLPVERFTLWSMPHYPLHEPLTALGFRPDSPVTHFVAKGVSEQGFPDGNPSSYYITMGDSDVY